MNIHSLDYQIRISNDVITAMKSPTIDFFIEKESFYKKKRSSDLMTYFYHFVDVRVLEYSRLDILKHLDSHKKLPILVSERFDLFCGSSAAIIDFYIFTKNYQFTPSQINDIKTGLYKHSGIWEKLEKRELSNSLPYSPLVSPNAPTLINTNPLKI